MRTRENVIWQDGLLDEKIEEKVCKYLESKHPEYRSIKEQIRVLLSQNPKIKEVLGLDGEMALTVEEHEASYLPIKGLQQLLKTIGKVRKQINPKLQVGGILFTMVDAHTNDARNNMELLRNVYGSQIHIFDNYIPFSVRMKEAVREGQSIFSYDPKGKATEAYRRVTEEVLKDAI